MKTKLQIHWPQVTGGSWKASEDGMVSVSPLNHICNARHQGFPEATANARFIAASKRMAQTLVKLRGDYIIQTEIDNEDEDAREIAEGYVTLIDKTLAHAGFTFEPIETETP